MALTLIINGQRHDVDVDEDMPLLWVLRDELGLVGTKYSCGIGVCGACKVLVGDRPVQSCLVPAGDVDAPVTTIEGATQRGSARAVLEAWVAEQVAQCGYCQPGQVMATIALLERSPQPTDEEVEQALAGNLCRCATYSRIRSAVQSAVRLRADADGDESPA